MVGTIGSFRSATNPIDDVNKLGNPKLGDKISRWFVPTNEFRELAKAYLKRIHNEQSQHI